MQPVKEKYIYLQKKQEINFIIIFVNKKNKNKIKILSHIVYNENIFWLWLRASFRYTLIF
jgi:hypothetical protein